VRVGIERACAPHYSLANYSIIQARLADLSALRVALASRRIRVRDILRQHCRSSLRQCLKITIPQLGGAPLASPPPICASLAKIKTAECPTAIRRSNLIFIFRTRSIDKVNARARRRGLRFRVAFRYFRDASVRIMDTAIIPDDE